MTAWLVVSSVVSKKRASAECSRLRIVAVCFGACAKAMKLSRYRSMVASGGRYAGPKGRIASYVKGLCCGSVCECNTGSSLCCGREV
jgi:hypothetical protein